MSFNGSIKALVQRNVLIQKALRNIQILGPDSEPTANQTSKAAQAMNDMIQEWQNDDGCRCWASEQYTANAVQGTASYTHADGEAQIIDIESAILTAGSKNYRLKVVDHDSVYDKYTDKDTQDLPTVISFDDPTLYLYYTPEGAYTLTYYGILRDQDFSASNANYYFPQNWSRAISLMLAYELLSEYGLDDRPVLYRRAKTAYNKAIITDIGEYGVMDENEELIETDDLRDTPEYFPGNRGIARGLVHSDYYGVGDYQ